MVENIFLEYLVNPNKEYMGRISGIRRNQMNSYEIRDL